jgi:hypothetical protein
MSGDAGAFRRSGVCRPFLAAIAFLAAFFPGGRVSAAAQDIAIQLDPQRTGINFTLADVLHTVRGTFRLETRYRRVSTPLGAS